MTLFREEALRRHQLNQSGMRDPGSSVDMPNFRAPGDLADINRRAANEPTTGLAVDAQRRSTGTGVGENMQPPSARVTYADAGVMNTWADITQGNSAPSLTGYNPQLTRTEIASPEDMKAQETLARYVAMIKGAAQQKQA